MENYESSLIEEGQEIFAQFFPPYQQNNSSDNREQHSLDMWNYGIDTYVCNATSNTHDIVPHWASFTVFHDSVEFLFLRFYHLLVVVFLKRLHTVRKVQKKNKQNKLNLMNNQCSSWILAKFCVASYEFCYEHNTRIPKLGVGAVDFDTQLLFHKICDQMIRLYIQLAYTLHLVKRVLNYHILHTDNKQKV